MSHRIATVIIEDNENVMASLKMEIKARHPQINIIGTANCVKQGIELIKEKKPELIFMDINFPDGTAFDIFEQTESNRFKVIFTTAHSEYALRAFDVSALHYLMKPLSPDSIADAIGRFEAINGNDDLDQKLSVLKESLLEKPQKILLPTDQGTHLCNLADITRCEAANNYTQVYLNNGSKKLISKTLGTFVHSLEGCGFARTHHSHLVNLKYIKVYHSGRNSMVELLDGCEIPISQTYKDSFRESLLRYAKEVE